MKARIDAIVRREQAEYLERLLPANTGLLAEMPTAELPAAQEPVAETPAVEEAIRHANGMAARNEAFRGAGGLSRHLRGELVLP